MTHLERLVALAALLLSGAIFGFYFAWVCSTMWGLDDADPRVAIAAMQAMNASVRNWVFFPVFFATPFVVALWAGLLWLVRRRRAALAAAVAALTFGLGSVVFTATFNIPMNEELAAVTIPASADEAQTVWDDYSGPWQRLNQTRTVFAGVGLTLVGLALGDRRRRGRRGGEPTVGAAR